MAQKNDTLPLMMALVVTLGILGGGGWWFLNRSGFQGLAPNGAETGNNDGRSPQVPKLQIILSVHRQQWPQERW